MSTSRTSAAEYWLTQIDRSFGYPGYSEHSDSPCFPGLRIPEPPAIFSPLRCIVEVEVSFPLDRSVTGSATNPIAFVGRLGRAYSRPFLDLFLFAQKTVDFGLHCLDSILLPFCHRFSLFDEALDQQVLKLNDPGLLLSS